MDFPGAVASQVGTALQEGASVRWEAADSHNSWGECPVPEEVWV